MSSGALDGLEFLTVAEVAKRLRVSGMTIRRLIDSGELAAVRVGHSIRIPVEAARELAQKGTSGRGR